LVPGQVGTEVTGTEVVVTYKVSGDVSDFDQVAQAGFEAALKAEFSCYPPDCHASLGITAASVNLQLKIVSTSADTSALVASAEAQATMPLGTLSAMLGASVQASPEVASAYGVTAVVTIGAPSPPPPSPPPPSPPPSLPPSNPPPSPTLPPRSPCVAGGAGCLPPRGFKAPKLLGAHFSAANPSKTVILTFDAPTNEGGKLCLASYCPCSVLLDEETVKRLQVTRVKAGVRVRVRARVGVGVGF
jgi:hypothetical protein